MPEILFYIILGLIAGALSGLIGIGGGIIIIPALIFFKGFSQHLAQGTTLALMVPPVGILAAWIYYKNGHVDLRAALLICLGFFVGGLIGARSVNVIPSFVLEKIFGVALLLISLKMIFFK